MFHRTFSLRPMVEGGGFEPPKVEPADLQSAPFGRSGTPPKIKPRILLEQYAAVNRNNLKRRIKNWSWWTESNPRPADYKSAALPTELHQRMGGNCRERMRLKQCASGIFLPRRKSGAGSGTAGPGYSHLRSNWLMDLSSLPLFSKAFRRLPATVL